MSIKITFDSNVWRIISSPEKFVNNPNIEIYQNIRTAYQKGKIIGYLSETTFTLEQIQRNERMAWLLNPHKISIKESSQASNNIHLNMTIGSNNNIAPAEKQIVKKHLEDAYNLGIRILPSNRICGPISPLLKEKKYYIQYSNDDEYHKYNNENGKILRELETMKFGIYALKQLGSANCSNETNTWYEGLSYISSEEKQSLPDLIAEWADVDALATSIAHGISFFCSNDIAKGAKGKGINLNNAVEF